MLKKDMNAKVAKDLNVPMRRARAIVDIFHKSYTGRLEAVTAVSARYNNKGEVEFTYIINDKKNRFTIGGGSLYTAEADRYKAKHPRANTERKRYYTKEAMMR